MKLFKNLLLAAGLTLAIPQAEAKVTLPSFFTDNMVLQQKTQVPFFGKSTAKEVKVTTSWDKKTYTVKVVNGKWETVLQTPAYGGPYTITLADGDTLKLKNILIGEVWLCSGQSNMEMPIEGWGKVNNYQQEIKDAKYPEIRLLQAEHVNAEKPQENLVVQHGGWQVCSPETVADFSSTAYFFARKVWQEKHIPIGLIHSSWGGTPAEAWTSAKELRTLGDFNNAIDALNEPEARAAQEEKYKSDMAVWNNKLAEKDGSFSNGKALWAEVDYNDAAWGNMPVPSFYENNVLPDFDGLVWYRKSFDLPEGATQDGVIEFYVDDDEITFFNGVKIGETRGYNTVRKYTIPATLFRKGKNVLTVRSFDGAAGGGIYAPDSIAIKIGSKTIPLNGMWKYQVGVNSKNLPPMPVLPQNQNRPTVLYNAMIYPLLKYRLAGVIWYQGETNAERAQQYKKLFPLMINNWRKDFNIPNLPFYFVQLANWKQIKPQPAESDWAELREAQFKTLSVPNTGMAVTTDIGASDDIHPKNKQDVGNRLALIALNNLYGVKQKYTGPLYKNFTVNGNAIALTFLHNQGIKAKQGELKGFAIAGADKVFHWATAKVVNGKVIVSSPNVTKPEAVRYNWADNPQGNLTNDSDLPASSFRTDAWPGLTDGKK